MKPSDRVQLCYCAHFQWLQNLVAYQYHKGVLCYTSCCAIATNFAYCACYYYDCRLLRIWLLIFMHRLLRHDSLHSRRGGWFHYGLYSFLLGSSLQHTPSLQVTFLRHNKNYFSYVSQNMIINFNIMHFGFVMFNFSARKTHYQISIHWLCNHCGEVFI